MPSRFVNRSTALVGLAVLLLVGTASIADAQGLTLPGGVSGGSSAPPMNSGVAPLAPDATMMDGGAIGAPMGTPMSAMSSGQYYNPTLGSHLRARYSTRSYGQQEGTLDLGTMRLMELDGGIAFLDGQVTMNDDSGVGYNLGVGYRWMTLPLFPWSPDDEKIMGVSIWSDGQTIGQENFFNQVGVSLEFLGEHLDFRANGYAPVGPRSRTRDFNETGELTFTDHFVAPELLGVRDTALTVGEAEVAGRLSDLDAWAFASVYGFNGGGYDAVGGKLGLRGYATPDLLLSIAVANDDLFDTNALFSATWFIGRTRVENCPTGVLSDRMREPVFRNNYIATQQSAAFGAGDPLLDPNGELVRLTHLNSGAAGGGDGSFERPLNSLDDILLGSEEGDIVYAHSGSDFNGQTGQLLDDQILYGEGLLPGATDNNPLLVTFLERGTVELPETRPGAAAAPTATIDGGAGAGIVLADNNLIQNLTFDGGLNAIITDTALGSNNPTLRDLDISGTTGDAIVLDAVVRADTDDIDGDDNVTEMRNILGGVTIEDIAFNNVGGRDLFVDAEATGANPIVGENLNIARVTSTNNTGGPSIEIRNTNTEGGGSTSITDYTYTDGTGGLLFANTGSSVTVTESDFTGGTGPAVTVDGNLSTSTVTVGSTNTITNISGDAVVVNANEGVVNVDADISTDTATTGGTVQITANEAAVGVGGDLEANDVNLIEILNAKADISIGSASGGTVQDGTLTHTGTGVAISITDDGNDADTANASIGITVEGDVVNTGGQSVNISGGNDVALFSGTVADTGGGIEITSLTQTVENADGDATNDNVNVQFDGRVNVGTAANPITSGRAVSLSGNSEDSIVTFRELDLVTTDADALVSLGGELNVGDDGTGANPAPDSTITTTGTGRAMVIIDGSSTAGVNFASVNTANPSVAVQAVDFDGRVAINGGTIGSSGEAFEFANAEFALRDVAINSGAVNAVRATFADNIDRSVSLTDIQTAGAYDFDATGSGNVAIVMNTDDGTLTGGPVDFFANGTGEHTLTINDLASTGTYNFNDIGGGSLDVDITDSTGVGNVSFASSNAGTSSLDLNGFSTTGSYDYDASGVGELNVTMTGITGGVDTMFRRSGTGDSTLDITDATTTGDFDYDLTSSGALAVTMTDVTGNGPTTMEVAGSGDGTLAMTEVTTGGLFDFGTTGAGDVTVTMNDVTGVGPTTLDTTGAGNASLTATTLDTGGAITATGAVGSTGDLSVNTTDSGNTTAFTALTVNQQGTGVTTASFTTTQSDSGIDFDSASDTLSSLTVSGGSYGDAAIAFDETGGGDGNVSLTNVADVTTVTVNEAGDGNASLTMSGETYDGAVALNETGEGNATASLTNVAGVTTVTVTEDADGDASLTMSGETFDGAITLTEAGDGAATANLTNVTSTAGVTVTEAADGAASLTMTGGTYAGDIVFSELGAGTATSSLTNVTTTGMVDFDTAGAGAGSLTVDSGSYGGMISATAANGTTGAFTARVINGTVFTAAPQIVFSGQNTGALTYEVSGLDAAFNTGIDVNAIDLLVGANVTTGNVTVSSNTGVQTLDGSALNLDVNGGVVNFLLSSNTFTNNSGTLDTVVIDHAGTTLNTTILDNSFNNTGVADEFTYTNASGSTSNLRATGNGLAGSGYEFVNSSAQNDFSVRGADAASVDGANSANVTFTGLFNFDNNLNVETP